MTEKAKSAIFILVVVGITVGLNWACPNGNAKATEPMGAPEAIELDQYEITFDVEAKAYAKIPRIIVRRGGTVVYTAPTGTAFFLFPDPGLAKVVDGVETRASSRFVAFMVGDGTTGAIKVPRDFPNTDKDVEIPYSVLTCTGEGFDMTCQYLEGESPPMIIIPRFPSG